MLTSLNHQKFRERYLIERDLGQAPPRLGILGQKVTEINLEVANMLNGWMSDIYHDLNRYVRKIIKRDPNLDISIRGIELDDWNSGSAASIVVDFNKTSAISGSRMIISVFDSNKILVELDSDLAQLTNKGEDKKFLNNLERASGFAVHVVERAI